MKRLTLRLTSPLLPTLLLSGGLLIACGDGGDETSTESPSTAATSGEKPDHEGHAGTEGAHDMETLAVEKRVAFMSGHVEAGLALYRAGAPDQAAKHLLHPVSETHAAERAGIDALGFTGDVFEAVSKALDEGREASEIEPMLQQAEANTALLRENAGGNPKEIIAYLMDTVIEEYSIGVTDGLITDPGEYQDAYGFSVVAWKTAKALQTPSAEGTVNALETLVALWPANGPLAESTPTVVADVVAQAKKVTESLSAE